MTDPTAARRVATYRSRQSIDLGFGRTEARVAVRDRPVLQRLAAELRRRRTAARNNSWLDLALGTINAPRPIAIDAETLLDCLLADRPHPTWQPHLDAFFTELSVDLLHHLVLTGYCSFDDLRRAQSIWGPFRGDHHDWIDDMAHLSLEHNACRYSASPAGTSSRR